MLLTGKYRTIFFVCLVLALVFSGFGASKLKFSFQFEEFFSSNNPEIEFYQDVKNKFDPGDQLLIIGITNHQSVFDLSFLNKLSGFENELSTIEGVKKTLSLTSLKNPIKGLFLVKEVPFIHLDDYSKISEDTTKLFNYLDVFPKFVSQNRKSTCLFISLNRNLPENFTSKIETTIASQEFSESHIYGLDIAKESYEANLKKEIIGLSLLALFLIAITIYLSYRSMSFMVISIFFLGCTISISMGITYLVGASINILTVTIPPIIAIVSMSDLVHIFTRFVEEEEHLPLEMKIKASYKDMNHSLLLTSLTTAVGFLSLAFTDVLPFIHFGIITALGIGTAYVLTLYLTPLLILFIVKNQQFRWALPSNNLAEWISAHKVKIISSALVISIFSVYLGSQVKINTYIFDDLNSKDPLSKSLAFFETNFFGIRDLDLYLTYNDSISPFDPRVITEMDKLEAYLTNHYGARSVYSLATQVKRLNRMNYGGLPSKYEVPKRTVILDKILQELKKQPPNPLINSLVSKDLKHGRIQVKSTDWGSALTKSKNIDLVRFIDKNINTTLFEIKLTGDPYFLDQSNEEISMQLFKSLITALIIVLIIVGVLYKSVRMAIIALIPNVFPLLMMLLIMYCLDISLKKSTAVVFTIAFGIAVDDTLHFLSRLHTNLKNNIPVMEAVKMTLSSTGKAILITSILLIGGFGSFVFSTFHSTFLTGSMISIALLTALITDLILLPALILQFFKKDQR